MGMNYQEFKEAIEAAGLKLRECNEYHVQITGCLSPINLHFNATGMMTKIYVNGMQKGIGREKASFEEALKIATKGEIQPDVTVKRMSRNRAKNIRKRLAKTQEKCFWCGKPLVKGQTSLEHKIPLKDGGSNERTNLVLCCLKCNEAKREGMKKPGSAHPSGQLAVDAVFAEIGAN